MRLSTVVVLAVAVVACGDAATTTPAVDTASPTTSVVETSPSSAPATSAPTTLPPSTDAPTTTVSPEGPATLDDGRPSTFLAVTTDYEAVEVDTASGDLLRSIGQMSDEEDLEEAGDEAAHQIVIDSLWRTRDGSLVIVSECCEPAAGTIHYLGPDERLTPETHDDSPTSFGWYASPSPAGEEYAVLGYHLDVGTLSDRRHHVPVDSEELGFPSGQPAWARDGTAVSWLAVRDGETLLHTLDLTVPAPAIATSTLDWVTEAMSLDGLTTQASGNLVAFAQYDESSERLGVVISPDGDRVATFPIEDGSWLGGYDPSGVFLVYVDGDHTARWQGAGRAGTLGEGYLFASW